MQYELAKMILPFVLLTGNYDSDPQSLAKCRETIDVQEKADEKRRTNWLRSVMGNDGDCRYPAKQSREAQTR